MNLQKIQRILFLLMAPPLFLLAASGLFLSLKTSFDFIEARPVPSQQLPYSNFISISDISFYTGRAFEKMDRVILRPNEYTLTVEMKDGEVVQIHPQNGYVLNRGKSWVPLLNRLHNLNFFNIHFLQTFLTLITSLLIISYMTVTSLIYFTKESK